MLVPAFGVADYNTQVLMTTCATSGGSEQANQSRWSFKSPENLEIETQIHIQVPTRAPLKDSFREKVGFGLRA